MVTYAVYVYNGNGCGECVGSNIPSISQCRKIAESFGTTKDYALVYVNSERIIGDPIAKFVRSPENDGTEWYYAEL